MAEGDGVGRAKRHATEHDGGKHEPDQDRQGADCQGRPAAPTLQLDLMLAEQMAGRGGKSSAAARAPFQQDHPQHEGEQEQCELGRSRRIAEREPGAIDAGGEGAQLEIGDGTEVGQGLHHHERQSGCDRRPGQRHADAPERGERRAAQGSADLERTDRLFGERCPGQYIDIGVHGCGQDEDGPAERAHVGEPIVAPAPAGEVAQHGLNRPGHLQEVRVGVGQHIGRHGQRQNQRPAQNALAGEAVHGDQPSGTRADQERARADPKAKEHAVAQVLGEDGGCEVCPQALGRLANVAGERQQRSGDDQTEQRGEQRTAAGQPEGAPPGRRVRERSYRRIGNGHS